MGFLVCSILSIMWAYIGLMVQSNVEYVSVNENKINHRFIRKKSQVCQDYKFSNQHSDKWQLELFFLNECLIVSSFWNRCCGIRLKKIASFGVWGNGRLPQLNLPSALAEAKQGYSFLFAYWNVLIDFMKSRCHYTWLIYFASIFKIKFYCKAMASAFREINYRYRSGK